MDKFCKEKSSNCENGTQWSSAFTFNATCLILTSINFIILAIGGFYFQPRYWGTFCNLCYACCHCSAFSLAIGVRFNPLGIWCSYNIAPIQWKDNALDDSHTYQSDGGILAGLGIIQFILWCVQCYCCCLPLYHTPIGGDKDKDKKNKHKTAISPY